MEGFKNRIVGKNYQTKANWHTKGWFGSNWKFETEGNSSKHGLGTHFNSTKTEVKIMSERKIGFVGLGLMGGGMARNLLKAKYVLNVFDIDQSKMNSFKALGARSMASPKEVGEKSDIIFSSLPDPTTVKKVYLESDGVIEGVLLVQSRKTWATRPRPGQRENLLGMSTDIV